jgi:hypothetical protein
LCTFKDNNISQHSSSSWNASISREVRNEGRKHYDIKIQAAGTSGTIDAEKQRYTIVQHRIFISKDIEMQEILSSRSKNMYKEVLNAVFFSKFAL